MDFMTKIGGRKFWLTVAAVGVAVFLEIHSERGLTTTMAGFLATIISGFHAANYAVSSKFMNKGSGGQDQGLHKKVDSLKETMDKGFNPEHLDTLVKHLVNLNNGIEQVKGVTAQVAQAIVRGQQR